ncbi:prephenate dehydratase-like protein [Cercophora newfieldiana]|uniref:prephenate dehydratase n=1 Tax=Cercophora newfieldiana TaxID=92897 RepID=A0AA39Y7I5_9PEZI|nr:prephenate dehydratase-like protein [Cercophora newfieldiana]
MSQLARGDERVVAFLGPVASYSHQATKSAFPGERWELMPTGTIKEVFEKVQSGASSFGVVPFENSTYGTVTFTLDCLADRTGAFGDIVVCGEVYLDVHHFLLGRFGGASHATKGAADDDDVAKGVPLADLGHVKRVYSHPQAFGQTAGFFGRYLRGVETIDVSSTSKAAEMAAADESGGSAAVAGELAARASGLDVLARCIEDREDNTTRFFVVRRRGDEEEEKEKGKGEEYAGRYKSLVSFTVPHRKPGALADVLGCFGRGRLNLTSTNSLPSLEAPFRYMFFVEFEGSRFDDPEGRVKGVFESLESVAERWRWLGSWENQRR